MLSGIAKAVCIPSAKFPLRDQGQVLRKHRGLRERKNEGPNVGAGAFGLGSAAPRSIARFNVTYPSCQERRSCETRVSMAHCSVIGCGNAAFARGLCQKHYARTRRHGDPEKLGERGRPRDETKAGAREAFSHWSPRKFERRWQARKKALETPDNRKE